MIEHLLNSLSALTREGEDDLVSELRALHEDGVARGTRGSDLAEILRRIKALERRLDEDMELRSAAIRRLEETNQAPPPDIRGAPSSSSATDRPALSRLQALIVAHPYAAREIAQALMAEGARFAQTPEGADWARRLRSDPTVQKLHMAWDRLTLGLLGGPEDGDRIEPSTLLDALFAAARPEDHEDTDELREAREP